MDITRSRDSSHCTPACCRRCSTIFLTLHVLLFRRHGLTVRDPNHAPDTTFWPEQVLRDAVACLGVAIVVLVLVLWNYPTADPHMPIAQQLGAELGAPANPAESYAAARPETYFLFLFQSLKYLEGFPPIVGAIVVPGLGDVVVVLDAVHWAVAARASLQRRVDVRVVGRRRRTDRARMARRPQRQDTRIATLSGRRRRCGSASRARGRVGELADWHSADRRT